MENEELDQIPEENYDVPKIDGEIDTVGEEIEYLEKKKKIPVVIWMVLILLVSILTLIITMNQSPTLTP